MATAALAGAALAVTSTTPSPAHLILKPRQVGPRYRLQSRPDGHGVKNLVTLDLCGFTFHSERLRAKRLQVNYVRPGSPVVVSNEVVVYRPGGTKLALSELRRAIATCPRGPVDSNIAGIGPITYRLKKLRFPALLPGSIALRVHITGKANGRHVDFTSLGVYQVKGAVLSGVYTMGGAITAQERLAAHAAAQSAKNLRSG
jgi:hypothetical protein